MSTNGQIVAAIKTASGKTAGGNIPAGKIGGALAELYFLTLAPAKTRFLVLTTRGFYDIMDKKLRGRLAPGITLKFVELPPAMQEMVDHIQKDASKEVRSP